MRRLRAALRRDPKTLQYCDGNPNLSTVADCVRNRAEHIRSELPGAGRLA